MLSRLVSIARVLGAAPPPASPPPADGHVVDRVAITGSPRAGPSPPPRVPVARAAAARVPGTLEEQAVRESERQSDVLRADEVHARMAAERAVSEARIAAIMADVHTELLRVWQEVLIRRQKVMADLLDKWSKVMFG